METSPIESSSPAATLRKMRRMILPDRVLGRSEYTMKSGVAIGPMAARTAPARVLVSEGLPSKPSRKMTKQPIPSPLIS